MIQATSLRFASAARALGQAARTKGWVVPAFRSPPRLAGAERTMRRRSDGSATVSVRLQGRPFEAVIADMVEGVVVANGLDGIDATRVRTYLWEAVTADSEVVAA